MIKVDRTVITGLGLPEMEKGVRKEPEKTAAAVDKVDISEDGKRKHILSQIQARISGQVSGRGY
ncbi:MAG: hypothetical protein H3C68_00710 [Deltaproteobacteria bacterium]|nr:hypothetical protein [Deltaproteobacteria bacterium]MBZ0219227.1 hypothetical protein [Deltaproteobacteria bacterium]